MLFSGVINENEDLDFCLVVFIMVFGLVGQVIVGFVEGFLELEDEKEKCVFWKFLVDVYFDGVFRCFYMVYVYVSSQVIYCLFFIV